MGWNHDISQLIASLLSTNQITLSQKEIRLLYIGIFSISLCNHLLAAASFSKCSQAICFIISSSLSEVHASCIVLQFLEDTFWGWWTGGHHSLLAKLFSAENISLRCVLSVQLIWVWRHTPRKQDRIVVRCPGFCSGVLSSLLLGMVGHLIDHVCLSWLMSQRSQRLM